MQRVLVLIVLVLIVVSDPILSTTSLRAETGQVPETVSESYSVRMVQISEPPIIDGKLDEAVWTEAAVFSNFTQVRPHEGALPSENTEVRLLQDADFLYIGIRAYDSEPDKIIAKEMQRDISLRSEDRVRFTIDTFHNLRGGYYFAINALGSRQDGLVTPGVGRGGYQPEWDGIWYGKSSIDSLGWVAEIAIPAKTLTFNPRESTWGFNVERDIERKGERVRWSGTKRNKSVTDMSDAGVITHIREFSQGRGIDIVPYLKADYDKDHSSGTDTFEIQPGLDIFYKVTPAVTLALSVNTDFAETEVDDRRVNLTRFPLFFEERRDFFLQDANIFSFGKLSRSPLPFNSRRIGLTPNREPLDIIAGGKITGRVGNLNFGVLNVQVDEFENLESKNLTVGRASVNIFGESEIGIIVTHGDPSTNGNNSLIGYDFNYKNSDFQGSGQIVESNFYVMKSFTSGLSGDDLAYGASVDYPNDEWDMGVKAEQIEQNFNPALGFVEETGTRQYEGRLVRTWHPDGLESISLDVMAKRRTRIDGQLIDQVLQGPGLNIRTPIRDELFIAPLFLKERLFDSFEIVDGVVIPRGTYSFSRIQGQVASSDTRPLSASLLAETGDFFTGKRTDLIGTVGWRPSPHF
ncbi:MAG: carbohydrate binding family 9 domain-containing protein, partial [Verrucomicrobia bacterium]|nr:carbohydrate binding family 9 domain-containing protein [Verrucomicrobiota bacterium]